MKLLTFATIIVLVEAAGKNRAVLNSVLREMFLNSTADVCPTCAQKKIAMESILSESEIKKFRIEQIKKTILDALGLERPPANAPRQWPQSILSGPFLDRLHQSETLDDTTSLEKLVLIPQDITCEPDMLSEDLMIKMKYDLPDSVDPLEMISAAVWLDTVEGKERLLADKEPKKFFMEFLSCDSQSNEPGHTFRGFQSFSGDWIQFDALPLLKNRLLRGQKCFNISLTMKNWSRNYCKKINIPDHKPFLTIHHKGNQEVSQSRLKRRSRNCTRSTSECCRENLYVSFEEIGWDNFIISPRGYEAYYCKGSCSTSVSSVVSATNHNSVIQGLIAVGKDLPTCCGPTAMSPMQFLFSYSNTSVKLHTMDNSIVLACGCL